MPATHHQSFRVRYHECDAYGNLQNVNYLRYMQEAAFGASAAAGYDFARYDQLGHLWLARETRIEYLQPLHYEDRVEIKTWVHDYRRFRSQRRYEFTHLGSGQRVAQAATDWVYISAQSGRPAPIPEEMLRAFFPEGLPSEAPPRERQAFNLHPPENVFTLRRRVAWPEIDTLWHVTNAVYLNYIQAAGLELLGAAGWPLTRLREAGLRFTPGQQSLEYNRPAVLDDELEIAAWVSDLEPEGILAHFRLHNAADGRLIAQGQTHWQCAAHAGGAALPFPAQLLDDLRPFGVG